MCEQKLTLQGMYSKANHLRTIRSRFSLVGNDSRNVTAKLLFKKKKMSPCTSRETRHGTVSEGHCHWDPVVLESLRLCALFRWGGWE